MARHGKEECALSNHHPVIDAHVHLRGGPKALDAMRAQQERYGHDACCALSLEGAGAEANFSDQNALCMAFKARYPGMYAFCGLNHLRGGFEHQARALYAAGCDGFKMIEGKPDTWKRWDIALDDEAYHGFYAFCEREAIPITLHTADPEDFWDLRRISRDAYDRGWYYDGTFPTKEALTRQTIGILERFSDLRLIMAHFFFLSGDMDRLGALMDRYQNLCVDITPGVVLYTDFSRDMDRTRAFFSRYQDRILFGTDTSDVYQPEEEAYTDRLNDTVRRFVETADELSLWDVRFRGARLPDAVRQAVFAGNFQRMTPHRAVDPDRAAHFFHAMLDDPRLPLSETEAANILTLWPKIDNNIA